MAVNQLIKQRGPDFASIRFDLHPHPAWRYHDGNPVPMVVAVQSVTSEAMPDSPRKLQGDKARAYEVLANIIMTDGVLGATDVPPGIRSVGENRWREAFYTGAKPGLTQSAKRKAFGRAADQLLDLHMVGMAGGRVWLPRADDCSADVAGR